MRLRTLPVSLAGVVMGTGYAARAGELKLLPAVLCFAVAFLAQIASNFANEYYDYANGLDRRGREGPRRGVTEGDITPAAMKRATFAVLALACAAGLALIPYGGWWLIAVGVAIAAGVVAYSAVPYPLSHHGLGEVAVIVFFGIVPVNFTAWLCSGVWQPEMAVGSLSAGLLGANVLIVNNYRDAADDASVGKHTLAVIVGPGRMPVLYALNALVAMGIILPQFSGAGYLLPAITAGCALLIARAMTRRTGRALTPLLGMTAVLMFAFALAFALL